MLSGWHKYKNERMKVLKFGGTSVGSVNSMLSVKKIVEAVDDKVIVVVSALGGITDKLINTSKMAAEGNDEYEKGLKEIVNRHIEMVYTVIPAGRGREILLDLVNERYFSGNLSDTRPLAENIGHHCQLRRAPFVDYCSDFDKRCCMV